MPQKNLKLSKIRIVAVYVFCFLGAAISPLESYLSTGEVEKGGMTVAMITLLVGVITATLVMVSLVRRGRFMQFRL
ncbi:MAG: hypothetical protein ACQETO_10805 [Pseudomonadota bacterium]